MGEERVYLEQRDMQCKDRPEHGVTLHYVWAVGRKIEYVCKSCAASAYLEALPS